MIHRSETPDEPEYDDNWYECRACGDSCEEDGSLCEVCGELLDKEDSND